MVDPASDPSPWTEVVRTAQQAIDGRDTSTAKSLLQDAVEEYPDALVLRIMLALQVLDDGTGTSEEPVIGNAIEMALARPDATPDELGGALVLATTTNDFDRARQVAKRLNPRVREVSDDNLSEVSLAMGRVCRHLGSPEDAAQFLWAVWEYDASDVRVERELTEVLVEQGLSKYQALLELTMRAAAVPALKWPPPKAGSATLSARLNFEIAAPS